MNRIALAMRHPRLACLHLCLFGCFAAFGLCVAFGVIIRDGWEWAWR